MDDDGVAVEEHSAWQGTLHDQRYVDTCPLSVIKPYDLPGPPMAAPLPSYVKYIIRA